MIILANLIKLMILVNRDIKQRKPHWFRNLYCVREGHSNDLPVSLEEASNQVYCKVFVCFTSESFYDKYNVVNRSFNSAILLSQVCIMCCEVSYPMIPGSLKNGYFNDGSYWFLSCPVLYSIIWFILFFNSVLLWSRLLIIYTVLSFSLLTSLSFITD
jgi:hypothetical protein